MLLAWALYAIIMASATVYVLAVLRFRRWAGWR